jgi:hypothetical protein
MKKIEFTKKTIFILIASTVICLFIEPIGYYNLYLKSFSSKWNGIIFSLACIAIILFAKPSFPDKPVSLKKWLYFMSAAFLFKTLGQLLIKIYINTSIILILYVCATILFISSLITVIVAFKNI